MKKPVTIFLSLFMFQWASAQYCGSPDTLACVTTSVPDSNGLYPPVDSFPPIFNNFLTEATIYFRNYDTILFGSEVLPVYSLTWDTIENLPPGLCWSTNKSNNTYATGEAGCIHIRGLACGPTGQYKLSTLVTVNIGIPVETDGDPGGLGYFMRLNNYGDTIIEVDTTQTDSMPFIPYGGVCQLLTSISVNLGPDQMVCAGSIATFNPIVSGGQPPYTYLWQSLGSNIVCVTCPNASVTVNQNSTYILKVTDASGGYGYDTVNYTVTGTAYNFQITAPGQTTFCGGGAATISGNANDSVSFQWYNNAQSLTGATGYSLTVTDSSGAYFLIYTETGGCRATSNIVNLVFYDTSVVTITSLSSDTICVGGDVTLVAGASGSGLTYNWLINETSLNYTNPSLTTDSAGFYRVAVTNANNCTDTSAGVLVVQSPDFPPTLTYSQFPDDTICNNAGTIVLTGALPLGGYYSGRGVTDTLFNPNLAGAGLNFIYYSYTDSTGCGNTITDSVEVLLCTSVPELTLPDPVQLYPNPANNQVTVQSALLLQGNAHLAVFDITGKQLYISQQRSTADKVQLDIKALASGYYLVQLQVNGRQFSRRFVKTE